MLAQGIPLRQTRSMPSKRPSQAPDAEALPDAVERLADEVRTLCTALDDFQDSFAYELRRLRDSLAEVMGHTSDLNADDLRMVGDGIRVAARQVERTVGFPGETPAADLSETVPLSPSEASTVTPDIAGGTSAASLSHSTQARSRTGLDGKLF